MCTSGRNTETGEGLKLHILTIPSLPTAVLAAWMSARWPRWTASKFPIDIAVFTGFSFCGKCARYSEIEINAYCIDGLKRF